MSKTDRAPGDDRLPQRSTTLGEPEGHGDIDLLDDRTPREIIARFKTRAGKEVGDELAGDMVRWLEAAGLVIVSRADLQRITRLGARFARAVAPSGADADVLFAGSAWLRDDLGTVRVAVASMLFTCSAFAFAGALWSAQF